MYFLKWGLGFVWSPISSYINKNERKRSHRARAIHIYNILYCWISREYVGHTHTEPVHNTWGTRIEKLTEANRTRPNFTGPFPKALYKQNTSLQLTSWHLYFCKILSIFIGILSTSLFMSIILVYNKIKSEMRKNELKECYLCMFNLCFINYYF
jgi:hypothetical protein